MKCQREEVLKHYLKSVKFKEETSLSEQEIESINFRDKNSDLLVEAMKKLIFSYCNDDSDVVTLRNVNSIIN